MLVALGIQFVANGKLKEVHGKLKEGHGSTFEADGRPFAGHGRPFAGCEGMEILESWFLEGINFVTDCKSAPSD